MFTAGNWVAVEEHRQLLVELVEHKLVCLERQYSNVVNWKPDWEY